MVIYAVDKILVYYRMVYIVQMWMNVLRVPTFVLTILIVPTFQEAINVLWMVCINVVE